jgi:hypothetical protein
MMTKLAALILAAGGAVIGWRWFARHTQTQVHRINQ